MRLQELLQKRAEAIKKQRGLIDAAGKENRDLNEQEAKQFEDHETEIKSLEKQIEREKAVAEREKNLDEPVTKLPRPMGGPVQDDPKDDGGFKNIGELLHAVKFGDPKGRLKDLATGDVGILIPPQFSQNIMKLDPEQEIVMPRSMNIEAGDPPDAEFAIPYFQQGEDGALGGIQLYWTAEGKTVSDAGDPNLKDLVLKPQEVSGMATVNNKTLINWQAAGSFIQNLLRQAWVSGRDYKFLRGSGAGCPLGILSAPGSIKVKRKTAATITYEDAAKMLGRMLPQALEGAVWLASISALPTITQMADGAGRLIYVQGDATKGVPSTLLGRPVIWTGKQPVLGSQGDLVLVNFNYYLTKAGSGPYIAISEHVKFTTNKTVFKIVANIDGQPWVKDPLKLEDGATTVSPYVILQ